MSNPIPAHAEEISLLDIYRTKKRQSQFAPLVDAIVAVVACPACSAEFTRPPINEPIHCQCGLHMQSAPAGFFIWRDVAQQAAE